MAFCQAMEECSPDTLLQSCVSYWVHNLDTFCSYDEQAELYSLREGLSLPAEICENLLDACQKKGFILDDKFLHIFKDPVSSHLRRINLRDSQVTDQGLEWLAQHNLLELDISGCTELTQESVHTINKNCSNLAALFIGNSVKIFDDIDIKSEELEDEENQYKFGVDYLFDCPKLRAFSVHKLNETECLAQDIISTVLRPLDRLTYLDLSGCEIELEFMKCLGNLKSLISLILYDVSIDTGVFRVISKMTKLK